MHDHCSCCIVCVHALTCLLCYNCMYARRLHFTTMLTNAISACTDVILHQIPPDDPYWDIEGYRTVTGFGVPNFRQAFPPQFRDQRSYGCTAYLSIGNPSWQAELCISFRFSCHGTTNASEPEGVSNAVWKQATVIALAVDVLKWACMNPEVVTSSSSRPLGQVALMAASMIRAFFELHEFMQEVFEAVIYNPGVPDCDQAGPQPAELT
jgi:hypothetical protein